MNTPNLTEDCAMTSLNALTDADGRAVAEHVERLRRTLDGLGERLTDAVARAVATALAGAVEAAVRAALADVAGRPQGAGRPPFAGGHSPGYWEDDADGWGAP